MKKYKANMTPVLVTIIVWFLTLNIFGVLLWFVDNSVLNFVFFLLGGLIGAVAMLYFNYHVAITNIIVLDHNITLSSKSNRNVVNFGISKLKMITSAGGTVFLLFDGTKYRTVGPIIGYREFKKELMSNPNFKGTFE